MTEMDDILKEFLTESRENLDQLDRDLLALEQEPTNRERLDSVFRTIHTIKGTGGFLELHRLSELTHAGENLLSQLRDGRLRLDTDIVNALLCLVDTVRAMLTHLETTGSECETNNDGLIALLQNVGSSKVRAESKGSKHLPPAEAAPAETAGAGEATVRVDVVLLDQLMNLVGELVLARNQILQVPDIRQHAVFAGAAQQLSRITTQLQERIMKTRMQPIGLSWRQLPRVVRDLAQSCGKSVRLDFQGEETEMDRTLVEAIKDPLTHLVRNAVDHGIETPAQRRGRGKPEQGRLLLRAWHESGQVHVEFGDDGAGIDPGRVKKRALERGLISAERAETLTPRECQQLIFLNGFSMADHVTSVSGRGVGMDVVKTNLERISGSVDLDSEPGHGTRIVLKIPLTLAIIPALIVACAAERYAIPQVNLLEVVRLQDDDRGRGIEHVHGAPVYRLRGKLLPLVSLSRELRLAESAPSGERTIVVVQADGRPFGILADAVLDTEEIVVKPLARMFRRLPLFAGATIRGDGRVTLILDVLELARHSNVLAEKSRTTPEQREAPSAVVELLHPMLVFGLDAERRMALPLHLTERLEVVAPSAIERAACGEVIQHRGHILPVVRLVEESTQPDQSLRLVVCIQGEQRVGLIVDRIVDIVETPLDVKDLGRRPLVRGSAVIRQRITDLLDTEAVFRGVAVAAGRSSA